MSGRFYEDLTVGERITHGRARTVSDADNLLFCGLTENTQPLHLDDEFARRSGFKGRVFNGIYTLGLVVGLTVPDLTEGTIVANLAYQSVQHPAPVYAGDTLSVESEVLEKRPSGSQPGRGVVRLRHTGRNQHGETVIEIERTVLFLMRPEGGPDAS
ncbi:MAG: MaoC family dehydratase [Anaerolineales bacterium]|nr:MaoC family dehydratase [Anaerolineales bacterium]